MKVCNFYTPVPVRVKLRLFHTSFIPMFLGVQSFSSGPEYNLGINFIEINFLDQNLVYSFKNRHRSNYLIRQRVSRDVLTMKMVTEANFFAKTISALGVAMHWCQTSLESDFLSILRVNWGEVDLLESTRKWVEFVFHTVLLLFSSGCSLSQQLE